MNPTTLERLMIDDALGALPPDVSALLAEHCPPADRAAWHSLAAAAKSAGQIAPLPLPAPRFRPGCARRVLAIAALLLLGLAIGLALPRPHQSPLAITPSPPAPQAHLQTAAASGVPDFWSTQRLLASAQSNRSAPQHWISQGALR